MTGEGFIPAGSSGWKLADGSDANLNFKDTRVYGKGEKGQYTGRTPAGMKSWRGRPLKKTGM